MSWRCSLSSEGQFNASGKWSSAYSASLRASRMASNSSSRAIASTAETACTLTVGAFRTAWLPTRIFFSSGHTLSSNSGWASSFGWMRSAWNSPVGSAASATPLSRKGTSAALWVLATLSYRVANRLAYSAP